MKYHPSLFASRLIAVLAALLTASTALKAAVPAVAVGYQHSLFLNADGEVLAAGVNILGQLGDGLWDSKSTPVPVLSGIQAVAAGMDHSLFLDTEGGVWRDAQALTSVAHDHEKARPSWGGPSRAPGGCRRPGVERSA